MNSVLCNATQKERSQGNNALDTDKTTIVIDNCCSYSIAKRKDDFIGEMKECNMTLQRFSGKCKVTKMGTWRFLIEDEDSMSHNIEIPNTLYAQNVPYHRLSLQHWSQQNQAKGGASCLIQHDRYSLGKEANTQITLF